MATGKKKTPRKRRAVKSASPPDPYQMVEPRTEVFSSGCCLLDQVLGGGWAYNRVSNIVGDRSTGKTLLAIEASANFINSNPDGHVVYVEAEAAFDKDYAGSLGLHLDRVEFPEMTTIEDVFEDLEARLVEGCPRTLMIIDSLDALSDRAEQGRKIDDGSYAMTKQKKLSELFRRMIKRLQSSNVTLMIVSQVRDAIGVAFGEKHKRSGGRALDFYASQVIWLASLGQIHKTVKGVKRTTGIRVKARCKKNKVAKPFRDAEFPLVFEYGVEDLQASLDWLIQVKRTEMVGMTLEDAGKLSKQVNKLTAEEYATELAHVNEKVVQVWREIEDDFKPTRRKYPNE